MRDGYAGPIKHIDVDIHRHGSEVPGNGIQFSVKGEGLQDDGHEIPIPQTAGPVQKGLEVDQNAHVNKGRQKLIGNQSHIGSGAADGHHCQTVVVGTSARSGQKLNGDIRVGLLKRSCGLYNSFVHLESAGKGQRELGLGGKRRRGHCHQQAHDQDTLQQEAFPWTTHVHCAITSFFYDPGVTTPDLTS